MCGHLIYTMNFACQNLILLDLPILHFDNIEICWDSNINHDPLSLFLQDKGFVRTIMMQCSFWSTGEVPVWHNFLVFHYWLWGMFVPLISTFQCVFLAQLPWTHIIMTHFAFLLYPPHATASNMHWRLRSVVTQSAHLWDGLLINQGLNSICPQFLFLSSKN